jgi:taurine dioxygenase
MTPRSSEPDFSNFRVQPVTAALGAEILDLDLNAPLADETQAQLRAALLEHLVLFFRDQHIDDEHHLALARCFGEPEVHPIRGALGDANPLHDIVDSPDSKPDRAGWHTDVTYMERPPAAAVLRCERTPEYGGDTAWANMFLAYDKLSQAMKVYLADLRGFHATDAAFLDYIERHLPEDACRKVMAAVGTGSSHPIVRTHPESGRKALFVDRSFMREIEGLEAEESRFVHEFLASRVADISIQCRFQWTRGAVAVWDERATQHAGAADHQGSHRVLRRCTIRGDRPV